MVFGATLSLNDFICALINNKFFRIFIDFLMLVIWGIVYFCITLAFRNSEYRFLDTFVTISGLLTYIFTIYKLLNPLFNNIGGKLNKRVKILSKKLKFDEKSFKKLLHFNK